MARWRMIRRKRRRGAHTVEKLRDPSHNRMLTPRVWSKLCEGAGLTVRLVELHPFKQPDLNWYFETAATTPENRTKVLELVANAPESARKLFRLGDGVTGNCVVVAADLR